MGTASTIPRLGLRSLAALALALAACSGANPPATHAPATHAPATEAPASQAADVRCALTPNASASATVEWNVNVHGLPTIKAGQAVAFITDEDGVTVTEGSNGKAAVNACIDEALLLHTPLLVTFYQPGDYRIFCRQDPTLMHITVRVQ